MSLIGTEHRIQGLRLSLADFGASAISYNAFPLFRHCGYTITGHRVGMIQEANLGATTSHLRTICKWLRATDEPVGFFCEDDLGLITVPYWNFTLQEFIAALPTDWGAVQLVLISEKPITDCRMRERELWDWSAGGYIMTRDYAEKLVAARMPSPHPNARLFNFDMDIEEMEPVIEHVLFYGIGKVYTCPLFVENILMPSTYSKETGTQDHHANSHYAVVKWWMNEGLKLNLQQLIHEHNNKSQEFSGPVGYDGREGAPQ